MNHYEKIKKIRKEQKMTIKEVYQRGKSIWGQQNALSISTINRIEAGKRHKFSSLHKLCFILGVELKELFKDTEVSEYLVIPRKERTLGYSYNEKAFSNIVNNPNQSFLAQEFTLAPSGRTSSDNATLAGEKSEKWVYVVRGELVCVIEAEKFLLKGRDTLSFDSTKVHYFKNASNKKCIFIVVENPGRY